MSEIYTGYIGDSEKSRTSSLLTRPSSKREKGPRVCNGEHPGVDVCAFCDSPDSRPYQPALSLWLSFGARGQQFMGIMLDVSDHTQYFSWMRELAHANLALTKGLPKRTRPCFSICCGVDDGACGNILGLGYAAMFQVFAHHFWCPVFYSSLLQWGPVLRGWFTEKDGVLDHCPYLRFGLGAGVPKLHLRNMVRLLFPLDLYWQRAIVFGNTGVSNFIAAVSYISVFALILIGQKRGQFRMRLSRASWLVFCWPTRLCSVADLWRLFGPTRYCCCCVIAEIPVYLVVSGDNRGLISWWPALYSALLTTLDPTWKQVMRNLPTRGVYSPTCCIFQFCWALAFLWRCVHGSFATIR